MITLYCLLMIAQHILYGTLIGKRCIDEASSKPCLLCASLDHVALSNVLFASMLRIAQSQIELLYPLIAALPTGKRQRAQGSPSIAIDIIRGNPFLSVHHLE